MQVQTKELDDAVIISLTGKMMLGYEAQDFHEAISGSLEKNKKKIVVDLSNLEFISSWGIGILIHGYTTVTNQQGSFALAAVPDIVSYALEKTKLDTIFQKFASVEEALKS
jgi:anti-sigma B factor antagonist